MSQVRITKIVPGAPGTSKYWEDRVEAYAARDKGLLKHSAWLFDIRVGDKIQIPYQELEEVRKACEGLCEFELEHPMYCNHHVGTDVYPYEILEWKNERTVLARQMDAIGFKGCYDGHYENYRSNPENPIIVLRERKNGGFNAAGEGTHCPYILSDTPYAYRDPCF